MIEKSKGDDDRRAEALEIGHTLLSHSDLPVVFRAHACMMLGRSVEPGYIEWAEEAVRVVKMGIEHATSSGAAEDELLKLCESVVERAKARFEEAGGYEYEYDDDDDDNDDNNDEEEEVEK